MSLINDSPSPSNTDEMEAPLSARNVGYQEDTPTNSEFSDLFQSGVTHSMLRAQERVGGYARGLNLLGTEQPQMSADEINKNYGPIGPDGKQVKITDEPMYEDVGKIIGRQKADEMDRNARLARFSDQHGTVTNLGASAVGFMMDPLQAVSAFVPGVGEASVLNGMGRIGLATSGLAARTAARTVSGATAGAISQAPIAALQYGLDKQQASDMSMRDAFKSVLYAAAGNAVFHAGVFGGAREAGLLKPDEAMKFGATAPSEAAAIVNAPAPTQHAAMQSALGQMVEGRQVEVDPLFPQPDGPPVSAAEIAERQSQTYRDGFAPGLTSDQIEGAKSELFPETEPKPVEEPGTEGPVLDQYKEKINAEAQRLGVPLDDARLSRAAETMAKDHNPEAPQGGPPSIFERKKSDLLTGAFPETSPTGENAQVSIPTKSGEIPMSKDLSTPDRDIEQRFAKQVGDNYKKTVYDYSRLPDTDKGVVLAPDLARELSPDYLAARTKSNAVQEPASWFIKKLYDQKLAEAPKGDRLPLVQFTAGGTGAGKTSAMREIEKIRALSQKAQIIYDSNMKTFSGSVDKIEKALQAGKHVVVTYVYRDPLDAFVKGVLPRAMRQEGEFGSGRTVPIDAHLSTHEGSLSTIKQLAEKYKDDERVKILTIDNSFGKGQAKLLSLDDLAKLKYDNGTETKIRKALDEERQKGTISESIYQGMAAPRSGDGASIEGIQRQDRPGDGGQPEPERDGGAPAAGDESNGSREQPERHPDDAAIADLETKIDLNRMTQDERGALNEAHTNYVAANDLYQQKLKDYTACLAANGE